MTVGEADRRTPLTCFQMLLNSLAIGGQLSAADDQVAAVTELSFLEAATTEQVNAYLQRPLLRILHSGRMHFDLI